jgi:hypothetical protein
MKNKHFIYALKRSLETTIVLVIWFKGLDFAFDLLNLASTIENVIGIITMVFLTIGVFWWTNSIIHRVHHYVDQNL